jgi:hypothetical protein
MIHPKHRDRRVARDRACVTYETFPINDHLPDAQSVDDSFGRGDEHHHLRQRMEILLPPVECADYEKHLALTKRALGKKEFTSAWKQGEKMSVEEVNAYIVQ